MAEKLKPHNTVRRFDVFAEYRKQDAQAGGMPADQAKGYGLWVAKVVAARRFGKSSEPKTTKSDQVSKGAKEVEPKFRTLSDELQTDETFDHDIIDRMGPTFYDDVFAPAIAEAISEGKDYTAIRDSIRKEWKPRKG